MHRPALLFCLSLLPFALASVHDTFDASQIKEGDVVFSIPDANPPRLWSGPHNAVENLDTYFHHYQQGVAGFNDVPDEDKCVQDAFVDAEGNHHLLAYHVHWPSRTRVPCHDEAWPAADYKLASTGYHVAVHQAHVSWTLPQNDGTWPQISTLSASTVNKIEELYQKGSQETQCITEGTLEVKVDFAKRILLSCDSEQSTPINREVVWEFLPGDEPFEAPETDDVDKNEDKDTILDDDRSMDEDSHKYHHFHDLWWLKLLVIFFIVSFVALSCILIGKCIAGANKQQNKPRETYAIMHDELQPGIIIMQEQV